jgi:predicted transposase YbfD/YdcC
MQRTHRACRTTSSLCATVPANPADIAALVRSHWQVENRAHYVRDVTFDEDRSQVRTGSAPQIMAGMKNAAISLLRLAGRTNIKQATEKLSRRLDQILTLLGV